MCHIINHHIKILCEDNILFQIKNIQIKYFSQICHHTKLKDPTLNCTNIALIS